MMISANGIKIHAEDCGVGDLALVFLHYWGGTSRTWKPVISALRAGLRTIALDARGWGQSDQPDEGYSIATMADDVAAAVTALGLKRYVLVGHSMGGKVAQLLASRRPEGLVGLILVAPSPAEGKSLADPEREAMKGAYSSPEAITWTIDNILAGRMLAPPLRDQVIEDSLGGASAAKEAWPATAISEDVSANLGSINVPVLVIGGENDKVDSVEMLRTVVAPSLPGATMTVIPGAGHLLPLEAPEELAREITKFIDSRLRPASPTIARPDKIPTLFDAALNRGDLDGLMALFHPKALMRMTDGTVVADGLHALRLALEALIAARPVLQNTVRRILVSDEIALLLLDWVIRITPPDGPEIVERGTATQIAERSPDGNWLLRIANPLGIN